MLTILHPKITNDKTNISIHSTAKIVFTFNSDVCLALSEALKPEIYSSSEKFVKTNMEIDNEHLTLEIISTNIGDLRAGMNSYIHLVKASYDTLSSNI